MHTLLWLPPTTTLRRAPALPPCLLCHYRWRGARADFGPRNANVRIRPSCLLLFFSSQSRAVVQVLEFQALGEVGVPEAWQTLRSCRAPGQWRLQRQSRVKHWLGQGRPACARRAAGRSHTTRERQNGGRGRHLRRSARSGLGAWGRRLKARAEPCGLSW